MGALQMPCKSRVWNGTTPVLYASPETLGHVFPWSWSCQISRTAAYGPVPVVVWERGPYPDLLSISSPSVIEIHRS